MDDENETKIRAATGSKGTESPVKSPVGVPDMSSVGHKEIIEMCVWHIRQSGGAITAKELCDAMVFGGLERKSVQRAISIGIENRSILLATDWRLGVSGEAMER